MGPFQNVEDLQLVRFYFILFLNIGFAMTYLVISIMTVFYDWRVQGKHSKEKNKMNHHVTLWDFYSINGLK